ncbi:hypothetical protein AB0E96_36415 [Kitasatospora sp. NPDC036755]|uniref:hypothetical protein n=1 Tax=Kitasatospora sp. NPDC036755 TaxID=3154600 RepID=UPI0033C6E054
MIDNAHRPDELGAVTSRHPVANGKRWVNASWALGIGVPVGWLGLWGASAVGDEGSTGANKAVGVLIGLGLAGLYIGVIQALRAVRGGPKEYFEVREHGLVHGSRRGPTVVAWEQVTAITIRTAERETGLGRQLGSGYRCVLRLTDGRRIRVDGLAQRHGSLGLAVLGNCPHASRLTGDEWLQKAAGWLLAAGAACLAAAVAMVLVIVGHPDRTVTDPGGIGLSHDVPGLSDGQLYLLSGGILVCVIAGVTCLALFVRARMTRG